MNFVCVYSESLAKRNDQTQIHGRFRKLNIIRLLNAKGLFKVAIQRHFPCISWLFVVGVQQKNTAIKNFVSFATNKKRKSTKSSFFHETMRSDSGHLYHLNTRAYTISSNTTGHYMATMLISTYGIEIISLHIEH